MHQHRHETHAHSHSADNSGGVVFRHILLALILIAAGFVIYIQTQNLSLASTGIAGLIAIHILLVVVIAIAGRTFFTRMIHNFHGTQESHAGQSTPEHQHNFDTTGSTIQWANLYDTFVRFVLMGQYRKMIESTVSIANIQANQTVLDVGCGTGTLAISARKKAPSGVTIHATDASREMIERAREKAREEGLDVEFNQGLIEDIHAEDATYDLVMNSLMVHHLPLDLRQKAFSEIYRVLKPGGRILIVDFQPPQNPLVRGWLSLTPVKVMLQIDNSIIAPVLQDCGFEQIEEGNTASSMAIYVSARKPVQ